MSRAEWAKERLADDGEELAPIEREYLETLVAHADELDAQVKDATEAVRKAVALAERYGISFEFGVDVGDSYIPRTLSKDKSLRAFLRDMDEPSSPYDYND